MVDRHLVTSGFDTETVVSEAYLSYLLLAQVEAGFFPLQFPVVDPGAGIDVTVLLHPPADKDYQRLYAPDPTASLPAPVPGSFGMELVPGEKSPVSSLAFSPDGTRLAAGSWDGLMRVWDVETRVDERTLVGHATSVSSVAFSPDGTHIASASVDGTVRLWDATTGAEMATFHKPSGPVFGVAVSPDRTLIASVGSDRVVRVREAAGGAPAGTFTGHTLPVMSVAFSPDGARVASGGLDQTVRLLMDFDIESQETDQGLERNHAIAINLVRLDEATVALLEVAGIDPQTVEDSVREQVDRVFPLGVAQGQQVQQIRIRKLIDGPRRSVGFYVNLALKSGPEPDAFHEPRGNIMFARDFREPSIPLCFATSPGLFALLGPDTKFRQAEQTPPGSGNFRYPLREDPNDTTSDEIGKIKNVTIGPELFATGNSPPIATGRLKIDVHGEYTDALGDPDFHLQLFFRPEIDAGLVDWDLDVDVDLGLLATILLIAGGIGLTLLFAPGLAWGSTLFVGTILGLAVLKELIAEPLAAKLIEDRLDEDQHASFFDALPFRVPAALRRWDAFYTTAHQVVVLVNAVTVNQQGIAFEGTELRLGKQPIPINHAVIRDEERAGDGAVAALRYRISDFVNHQADFDATAPGVDRMAFSRAGPQGEATLVSLTDAQIAERIGDDPVERRILAPNTYSAERIHLVDNQIDQLLCLSRIERGEQRRIVIADFRAEIESEVRTNEGDDIRDEVTEQLEQALGRPPTAQETLEAFNERIDERVDELFDERFPDFEENVLPDELEAVIAHVLRFDLAPEEMVERQRAGVVLLDGKEIIVRENSDGTITPYYRDHPDGDPQDNLLSLPHYSPPYQRPE